MQSRLRVCFSVRALLAAIAAIAILLVPLSYYVRYRMAQPDYFGGAVVYFESYKPNQSFIYQQLIDDPEIRKIKAIRRSSTPVEWLRRHLVLTQFAHSHLVVDGYGRRQDIERDELRNLIAAAVDVVRGDAEQSGADFALLSNVKMQTK